MTPARRRLLGGCAWDDVIRGFSGRHAPHPPPSLLALLLLLLPTITIADPLSIPFDDCFDEPGSEAQKFTVDTVYAQILRNDAWGNYLNLTVLGTSPQPITGVTNDSTSLATLFTTSSVLTLTSFSNSSYLCQTMRPPSPLPANTSADGTYCPLPSGPFAFSTSIPLGRDRELTTLLTQLRAVDPFGKSLVCLDMVTTPLVPRKGAPYGRAVVILWSTVAMAAAYWVIGGIARVASAWNRGTTRAGKGAWARASSAGYILASAISGERLATAPALMRFCTPSLRDVFFHTQWCAVLVMVAVEWPQFVYPLLTQAAWSTLSYNTSITPSSHGQHFSPTLAGPFSPPSTFADQFADPNSPLFINTSIPNFIFTLPESTPPGIASFAFTLGVRPQDLFPMCLILFLGLVAATIVISLLIWFIDIIANVLLGTGRRKDMHGGLGRLGNAPGRTRSPGFGSTKDLADISPSPPLGPTEETKSLTGVPASPTLTQTHTRFSIPLAASERGINSHRAWWRPRLPASGGFHGSALHGNLVRLLVLFHLPLTLFACYHLALGHANSSTNDTGVGTGAMVLAALSLVILSVLIPAHLALRVAFTSTSKLYSETRTLLCLGPLYAHYRGGSQLFVLLFFVGNLAFGVTIGAGQRSGTAQAIVILVVEVGMALVTSLWLPWGAGASMGLISFLFCVARIVIAVLLVILTQAISIGPGPGGWVAYGILIILALVYLALLLMLLAKMIEGILRIVFGIGFDRSRHTSDTGLLGVLGLLGWSCCGGKRKSGRSARKNRRKDGSKTYQNANGHSASMDRDSDLSSYMPPHSALAAHHDGTTTPPRFIGTDSRKGSTHSQPPSVLKPEHANRPYREEGDAEDEGYIMGAWQPFPRTPVGATGGSGPGYAPLGPGGEAQAMGLGIAAAGYKTTPSPAQTPKAASSGAGASPASSGFTRVGGGRAHIDSPYAISSGGTSSTHAFPSLGQQSVQSQAVGHSQSPTQATNYSSSALTATSARRFYEEPEPMSFVSVDMGVGSNGLPAGAMQPAHIRTKSQTAIVEDYLPAPVPALPALGSNPPPQQSQLQQQPQQQQQQQNQWDLQNQPPGARQTHVSEDTYLRPPAARFTLGADGDEDDSGDEQDAQKKKKGKPWYHIRRNRAHSSEDRTSSTADLGAAAGAGAGAGGPVDAELGGVGGISQPQRSFVVIRKPPSSISRLNQAGAGAEASSSSSGAVGNATYPQSSSRPPTR
ncbi:hypothetical protein BJ912DRAFT_1034832 [Pholiota molesta]|nr:hypothetical protein BJ912DRAFT_1034832 [Pholiota molesta]